MWKMWKANSSSSFIVGISVITVGLLLGVLIGFWWQQNLQGCGIMGVSMMISLFIGGYIISDNHKVAEGEVRRSIALPTSCNIFLVHCFWKQN